MTQYRPDWPYPALIAHRGAGHHAPENTLAAMRMGAAQGFRMMEYDAKLSQDGVALLLHDDALDRTSNASGNAADKTWAELAEVDAGGWHSAQYAGEPIPSLHAIAAFTRANQIHSNIEIKPHTGHAAETGKQIARLARTLWAGAALPPLLSSFSETALQAALKEAPELPRALLISKEVPADWAERAQRLKCRGLNLNDQYTTRTLVEKIRDAGYAVAVWTVNEPARARQLLNWGCNAVITDEIQTISPADFP